METIRQFFCNITKICDVCTFSDYVGIFGVIIILVAYVMLQVGYLSIKDLSYSLINLIGSVLLLYSLFYHWNLASVVIEVMWMAISMYGIWRTLSLRRKAKKDVNDQAE